MMSLDLANLGELNNGAAQKVIDAAIRTALADLEDRGQDGTKRVVGIRLVLQKVGDTEIKAWVQVSAKLPEYKTGNTVCTLKPLQPGVVIAKFNENAPENPNQKTFLDRERAADGE